MCPDGWDDASHLDLGCIKFFENEDVQSGWFEAKQFCESLYESSHLVEVCNQDQADYLQSSANNQNSSDDKDWWIGLFKNPEGDWVWTYSNTTLNDSIQVSFF